MHTNGVRRSVSMFCELFLTVSPSAVSCIRTKPLSASWEVIFSHWRHWVVFHNLASTIISEQRLKMVLEKTLSKTRSPAAWKPIMHSMRRNCNPDSGKVQCRKYRVHRAQNRFHAHAARCRLRRQTRMKTPGWLTNSNGPQLFNTANTPPQKLSLSTTC